MYVNNSGESGDNTMKFISQWSQVARLLTDI